MAVALKTKSCLECGNSFTLPSKGNWGFCSSVCRKASRLRHTRERYLRVKNTPEYKAGVHAAYLARRGEALEYQKRHYLENKARHQYNARAWELRKYGLTPEQFVAMVETQQGRCLICASVPKALSATGVMRLGSALNVDHEHSTGKVRGLLCRRCNQVIGLMEDNPELLKAAIVYLERRPLQCVS